MSDSRPNMLIVLCDQWRAQATGYAGDPNVRTPHLDALAKESIHCIHAVANSPVCTPSRATLLTGQYPHRHGLFINDTRLDPDLPSLGKSLRSGGYQTGWIGKWHVDGHGRHGVIPPGRRQGFELWKALECSHNYAESPYYDGNDTELSWWSGPETGCDYDAFAQTDAAIAFISGRDPARDPGRPFALVLSLGPPHNPYHMVPQRYRDLYDPAKLHVIVYRVSPRTCCTPTNPVESASNCRVRSEPICILGSRTEFANNTVNNYSCTCDRMCRGSTKPPPATPLPATTPTAPRWMRASAGWSVA